MDFYNFIRSTRLAEKERSILANHKTTRVLLGTTRSGFDTHNKETGEENVCCFDVRVGPRESNSVLY